MCAPKLQRKGLKRLYACPDSGYVGTLHRTDSVMQFREAKINHCGGRTGLETRTDLQAPPRGQTSEIDMVSPQAYQIQQVRTIGMLCILRNTQHTSETS